MISINCGSLPSAMLSAIWPYGRDLTTQLRFDIMSFNLTLIPDELGHRIFSTKTWALSVIYLMKPRRS